VLEYLGDLADYVSLHRYVGNREDDTPDYLAITHSIDRQIEEMDAACRFVQARRRSKKRAYLCFDEWNVWYRARGGDGQGAFAPHLIEEVYNLEDALVVSGFLHSFVRHADVVKIANLAQIVNVIAPVLTRDDALLVQSIYYPFAMFSRRREGISLIPRVDGPTYEARSYGETTYVDASAVWNEGLLHVFATNRSLDEAARVRVCVADQSVVGVGQAELLTGPGPKAANSFEQPDLIAARPFAAVRVDDGVAKWEMPPLSVAAVTLRLE